MKSMQIEQIKLEKENPTLTAYRNHNKVMMDQFDYSPFQDETDWLRLKDLMEKDFNRNQLVDVLIDMNKKWNAPTKTFEQLQRLTDSNSVVVIGGQQAGLLTGPTYTINKIISIVTLAKQKQEKLGVPVVPVFWIAGEDHDFEEINHIFTEDVHGMKKERIGHRVTEKMSASHLIMDKSYANKWVANIFNQLGETEYTYDLYMSIQQIIQDAETYVDFFARLVHQLFHEEGVVLIDSGDHSIRKLERDHFKTIIENQEVMSKGVYQALQAQSQNGFGIPLDIEETDAHLFYHKDGERILLKRTEKGEWEGKQKECTFTTEELLHIASEKPELLSNNVVTRPLMQELLFPTIAFVAGPGEISYWSVLKPAFACIGLKMPPVVPRISLTFMSRGVSKQLENLSIQPESAINNGVLAKK
ncbi:bacillithiol biosynthesis cysteine-adding enzyme BshC [Terrihalobacillus insolitus]|uniref:bacillithiol biosynthesis cysteine-adding enzyme BshC n=1 Tax=Terrihalobacillus insolitus TaxID=2950438 RepID=UPI00234095C6|nr:bacillithiol biosynthesis cysteine-adding enzyme BshC [Terrihalobacillus insolitus]